MEAGVRGGELTPGDRLPAVRELAEQLGVSPTTVAAAYGDLRRRGITAGAGRAGTRIRGAPPVSSRAYLTVPAGTRDLITGGPDPALLGIAFRGSSVSSHAPLCTGSGRTCARPGPGSANSRFSGVLDRQAQGTGGAPEAAAAFA